MAEVFPMHTREGVEVFLEQYHHIKEAMYTKGDFDALIMLVDFESAVNNCKLSTMELAVLQLVYGEDLMRVDVAKKFGVTKQTIQKLLARGTEKIAKYYEEMRDYDEL